MPLFALRLLLCCTAITGLAGCSSLTGASRDAIAPFFELSKPETIDNVIVGGTNPYATAVPNSFAGQGTGMGAPLQTISVFSPTQAEALPLLHQTMAARCGGQGIMGPVQGIQGQWVAQIQCFGPVAR